MLTNQNDLIKQLNKLRTISPDPAIAARGRALIFADATPRRLAPWLFSAGAFALIVIIAFVSLKIFGPSKTSLAASLNPDQLSQEFNNLSINIELKNISYHQDVNDTIASALTEISNNKGQHLNPDILKSEEQNLNLNSGTNPQIDELLKNIIL